MTSWGVASAKGERDVSKQSRVGAVAVVTGGGRGIGRAIVDRLLDEGMTVHSVDISHPDEKQAENGLHCHDCDITNLLSVEALFNGITSVDVLVNNAAAFSRSASISELTVEEWQSAMSVNVDGMFYVTRTALPFLRKGGCIVNMASTFAHVGMRGRLAYSTTKGAALAFTRSLALDVADLGIRVNSVSPGAIATERITELFRTENDAENRLVKLHPIGHMGRPEDIADAVWFLVSAQSNFMTGADLRIDGGFTAQ